MLEIYTTRPHQQVNQIPPEISIQTVRTFVLHFASKLMEVVSVFITLAFRFAKMCIPLVHPFSNSLHRFRLIDELQAL